MMKSIIVFLSSTLLVSMMAHADDPSNVCEICDCTKSDDAQILSMDCTNRNLKRTIDRWPQDNSSEIIKISLAGNDIESLGPFPPTDAVVEIILSECNIRYLEPGIFAAVRNVKFVDLSHNLLLAEEISPDKFKGPYNNSVFEPIALEHLDLSYNQIHTLGKNVFEHMPDLKILNLEGNDFAVLDMHTQLALSSIRKLQDLNLANNELTEMIVGAIESHENLTRLDLSRNVLDFVPTSLSQIGKSLEVLILDGNPIMEFVSETFLGLGNVIELSANRLPRLKYVNANTFASMPKLKKLELSNNYRLMDIDREAFGPNQTLDELYLNNNNLYRLDYKLLPWSKLHVFELNENPLECSCDLYNITRDLPIDITRKENGPYCMDPRNDRYSPVYYLKSDICGYKPLQSMRRDFIQYHFSMVRVSLIVLSVFVMMVAILAAILGFVRYRRYQRESSYPYASQIAYNPVSTIPKY